jgi:hypothetical protein
MSYRCRRKSDLYFGLEPPGPDDFNVAKKPSETVLEPSRRVGDDKSSPTRLCQFLFEELILVVLC